MGNTRQPPGGRTSSAPESQANQSTAQRTEIPIEEPDSRVKAWHIPLLGRRYRRGYGAKDGKWLKDDVEFVGREDVRRQFLAALYRSEGGSSSFLVTGYRGAGKTSFVDRVLEDYRSHKDPGATESKASRWFSESLGEISVEGIKCGGIQFAKGIKDEQKHWRTLKNDASKQNTQPSNLRRARNPVRRYVKNNPWILLFVTSFLVCLTLSICQYRTQLPTPDKSARGIAQFYLSISAFWLLLLPIFSQWVVFKNSFNGKIHGIMRYFLAIIRRNWRIIFCIGLGLLWLICAFISPPPPIGRKNYEMGSGRDLVALIMTAIPILAVLALIFPTFLSPLQWPSSVRKLRKGIWVRQRWRPVVSIHLNLGSQELSAREILLDMASLLRRQLTRHPTIVSLQRYFAWLIFPVVALLLALWVGKYFENSDSKVIPYQSGLENSFQKAMLSKNHSLHWGVTNGRKQCNLIRHQHRTILQTVYCEIDDVSKAVFASREDLFAAACGKEAKEEKCLPSDVYFGRALYPVAWIKYLGHHFAHGIVYNLLPERVPSSKQPPSNSESSNGISSSTAPRPFQYLLWLVIYVSLLGTTWIILRRIGHYRCVKRLSRLCWAMQAAHESNYSVASTARLSWFFGRKRMAPIVGARQAENMFIGALNDLENVLPFLPKPRIVFVFDELDKIEPSDSLTKQASSNPNGQPTDNEVPLEMEPGEAARQRKVRVETLVGSLKNLLTEAHCRFIFIGGREMTDANLADQSNTHHLYASIFTEHFYVPSFLTDASDGCSEDISSMVEQFVCRQLMRPSIAAWYSAQRDRRCDESEQDSRTNIIGADVYRRWTLDVYFEFLKDVAISSDRSEEERRPENRELIAYMRLLRDLVAYLTYRSRGNPKKLVVLFDNMTRPIEYRVRNERSFSYWDVRQPLAHAASTGHAIKLYRADLYQIEFVSSIYTLLLGEIGHVIRQYGDKLTLATFVIFDFLLKFHSLGFGPKDIERMPEMLDIHRAPALRQIIDLLVNRLRSTYLRTVSNGIYDYRYVRSWHLEVAYLSEISEQELAALNFTLDESREVKRHYQTSLLREIAIDHNIKEKFSTHDHQQLPALYSALGDLHLLDREYEDAVAAYRKAIMFLEVPLRSLADEALQEKQETRDEQIVLESVTPESIAASDIPGRPSPKLVIVYLRTLLKTGLIAEMRRQPDNALAIYFQAAKVVNLALREPSLKQFFNGHVDLVRVLYQPWISAAFLHAKRAPSSSNGGRIMADLCRQTEPQSNSDENAGSPPLMPPIVKSEGGGRRVNMRVRIRKAELHVLESNFDAALYDYRVAFYSGIKSMLSSSNERGIINQILSQVAIALLGIGDCCAAMGLTEAESEAIDDHKVANSIREKAVKSGLEAHEQCRELVGDKDSNESWRKGLIWAFIELETFFLVGRKHTGKKNNFKGLNVLEDMKTAVGDSGSIWYMSFLEGNEDFAKYANSFVVQKKLESGVPVYKVPVGSEQKPIQTEQDALIAASYFAFHTAAYFFARAGNDLFASHASWRIYGIGVHVALNGSCRYSKPPAENLDYLLSYEPIPAEELGAMDTWFQESDGSAATGWESVKHRENRAFHMVYALHQNTTQRDIENCSLGDIKSLRWMITPQAQTLELFRCYWKFYKEFSAIESGTIEDVTCQTTKALNKIDEHYVAILDLGQFPAQTHIVAEYLKGRAYFLACHKLLNTTSNALKITRLKLLTNSNTKPSNILFSYQEPSWGRCKISARLWWKRSLIFFSRFVNDATAYGGGRPLVSLPTGMGYFYLWSLLRLDKALVKKDSELKDLWGKSATEDLKQQDSEYALKRVRFLDKQYCREQALKYLYRLRERHGRGTAYFEFVDNLYYLYDDFSDPYLQAHWVIEYANLPAVDDAIHILRTTSNDSIV